MIASAGRLESYIDERLPSGVCGVGDVTTALLDAAFHGERGVRRRRPVIASDGTPVMFSHKASLADDGRDFRLLVEPGLASLTVSEQIDLSLATLQLLLADLNWLGVASTINEAVDALYPRDPSIVDTWWGGMGLGCAVDARGLELRVYCNVREGEAEERWRRFGTLAYALGDRERAGPSLEALIASTSQHGIPAGVALCIRNAHLVGVRLYVAVPEPSADAICVLARADRRFAEQIASFSAAYEAMRGYTYSCVTVAFDFPVAADGNLDLRPARFKADFDCSAPGADLTLWLSQRHQSCGLPTDGLHRFLASLERHFGGFAIDYVSLGCHRDRIEITSYVLPAGYATLSNNA